MNETKTTAENYKAIAAVARTKSEAYLKYEELLEEINNAAKVGLVAIRQTKYTVEGLRYSRSVIGDVLDYDKMYAEQDEVYNILRQNGFEVRMLDPELPSTLDINMPEETRQRIELTKRCIEKEVYIIWDVDEFDK